MSFKGTNVKTEVADITADTQYDFLVSAFVQNAANVDCMKKNTSGSTTTYNVYLNKAGTLAVSDTILELVNANNATGVLDVNNYIDTDSFNVKECELVIVVTNGKIVSVTCESELRYTPTAGEFTEYTVTLKNTLELEINNKFGKAEDYEAPSKATDNVLSSNRLIHIL
jgi:hypothetical protein